MGTERGRALTLAALVVVLLVVLYRAWTAMSASVPTTPLGTIEPSPRVARSATAAPTAPDVHLGTLDQERPKPVPADRNLFRFKVKPPPPAPPPPPQPVVVQTAPSAPPGPPPPPPIPLRFIGIIERPAGSTRLAALIDATGHPYHGVEGDVIAGQYRILKIGVESIEMAYLDGRGRQTIRLSGS